MKTVTGTVVSGLGRGRRFCSLPPYRNAFRDLMGLEVFPGTLNLELGKKESHVIWQYVEQNSEYVRSFRWEGKQFGAIQLAHVDINGTPAAIVAPHRTSHTETTVEIIAESKLRDSLGLEDGDRVRLEFPGRRIQLRRADNLCILKKALSAYYFSKPFIPKGISCMTDQRAQQLTQELIGAGALVPVGEGYELTYSGRSLLRVVFTGGVYDLLHVGHLATLQEARSLGDYLLVIVARDETVMKFKQRKPIKPEEERREILEQLRPVDLALLGQRQNYLQTALQFRPDLIVMGHDQRMEIEGILSFLEEKGYPHIRVERLSARVEGRSTTKLIEQAKHRNSEK